jgi:hypothetical protein
MLCLRRHSTYMLWWVCRDASYSQHLTASFDSFAEASNFARKPSSNTLRLPTSLAYLIKPPLGDAHQAGLVRENHCLHPVTEVELHQDSRHMRLDCGRTES